MHPKPNEQIKDSLKGGKIRLKNILCLDHFKQVGQAVNLGKKVLHTTTTEDSSPYTLMETGHKHLFLALS